MSKWLDNRLSEADHDLAFALAKGAYQRSVLLGQEALSGSTLRGRASRYRGRYLRSLASLLGRLREAGIPVSERRADHGRRVLVLGAAD